VFEYGTAARARSLGFNRPYAGKTGTTSNYRDAWFIGYSPRILSLVWIGFDDGRSVRLAGGDACVPIWTSHMNKVAGLVPDVEWKRPDDVVEREIDPQSGQLATPYCPVTQEEVFVARSEPDAVCSLHAGSGEPSPFWQEEQNLPESMESEHEESREERPGARREQERRRERGIRKLLKAIFGDGR
ncbi:MAG TPA: penicillin-binding protein, partial [Thermoanaerobaculia bacterium]|nr:penicillin-binding protein [Thermoanaerobaculia bacterium]